MTWLDKVGQLTDEHREKQAQAIARRGQRKKWKLRSELWSELRVRDDLRWYDSRARGQRERIERVRDCGSEVLRLTCSACGQVHERPTGCRIGILCLKCRGAIVRIKQACFLAARASVLEDASRRGLLWPFRPKGRYGEKFLTLTAPHMPDDSIGSRLARVFDAWPHFLKLLNTDFRQHRVSSAEWFRVFEWTPGDDDLGHPHIHLWLFCPFLPIDSIREWWTAALGQVGCRLPDGARAVVFIEQVDDEHGGARELIKYLTKDITSNGEKLAPELYAEVYKSLEGRRITQASRGFMGRANRESGRCECGSQLPLRVQRVKKVAAAQETKKP